MSSDKSENLSNSPSSCAAIFCCGCLTNNDVSDHQEKHDHSVKASDVQIRSRRAEVAEHKLELPSKGAAEKGGHGRTHDENEGKKSSAANNEMFTDYINRAKLKIRAMSRLGSRNSTSEAVDVHDASKDNGGSKDNGHGKDIFSDYIYRAKLKIRKTPTIGSRESSSRKRE